MTDTDNAYKIHKTSMEYFEAAGLELEKPWNQLSKTAKNEKIKEFQDRKKDSALSPDDYHKKRSDELKAKGWKYGSKKNKSKKSDPILAPYLELSKKQKIRDYINMIYARGS